MSLARPKIDVSLLPDSAMDARAPLWWGNLFLIFIETTTMGLLVASYFYIRRNFWEWPPPRVDEFPPMLDPSPALTAGTLNLILLVLSLIPMYFTDLAARRHDRRRVATGLMILVGITLVSVVLRFFEFRGTHFRWSDNAYASVVWGILVMHLVYLLIAAGEFLIMGLWALRHPIDPKHALDITLAGGYWYWLTGIWLPVYVILYWYPRWS